MPNNIGRKEFMRIEGLDDGGVTIFEGKNNEHFLKKGETISFEKRTDISLMHKIDSNDKITLLAMVDNENDIRNEFDRLDEIGAGSFLDSSELAFHISSPDALRMKAHEVMPEKNDRASLRRVIDVYEVKDEKMLLMVADDPIVKNVLMKGDVLMVEEQRKGMDAQERIYSKIDNKGDILVIGKESADNGYNASAELNHYKRRAMVESLGSDFPDNSNRDDILSACRSYVDEINTLPSHQEKPKKRCNSQMSCSM